MAEFSTSIQPIELATPKSTEDIAIVGYSFRLPQDVNDDKAFWEVLQNRKNLMTEWPASRVNADSFRHNPQHKFTGKGGHFLNDDVQAFDAPFFSVTVKEAASMDPMQRWTLEASYRALENAGIPIEQLRGSRTAVFSASMIEDYSRMTARDPDNIERMAATGGTIACIIPNRVSWYFDLRGPSIHVNTACSSSMSALDMACKSIRSGDASCALVTGCNVIMDPGIIQSLSDQNFLSPDGLCYSFDHRANGYARGEGVVVLVLKPVAEAVRNGDTIRAVIRSIGSNQDGHTPVLTQPSAKSQEDLIRHVYAQANLPLCDTRYVEAHGTGTKVGDPIEMKAIGRVFRKYRSAEEPLYVGSVKANFGHLEGASALVSVLKSISVLEKGVIPPNALFEKMNPDIDNDFYNTTVPTTSIAWPNSGLRRVSVNSFGFGGSNTHVVIDDAYSYLNDRGMVGNHCTTSKSHINGINGSKTQTNGNHQNGDIVLTNGNGNGSLNGHHRSNGTNHETENGHAIEEHDKTSSAGSDLPKILVFSAADEKAMKRVMTAYEEYFVNNTSKDRSKLAKLAYTLSDHRSRMLWRSYALAKPGSETTEPSFSPANAIRSSADANLAFVFTGQGAQYVGMGHDLLQFPVYKETLRKIDSIYSALGCDWSILAIKDYQDRIDSPDYSQPLSTAVQLGLVDLLKSFGLAPKGVVGHSSGEIAAAYSIGALTLESACKVAYFRGQLAGKLKSAHQSSPGAMISINLSENEVSNYLRSVEGKYISASVCTACINSPLNCTLSGPEDAIDLIKIKADKDGIFAQKLKTGVAYHSPFVKAIADEYCTLMGTLESGEIEQIPMVSSVSGRRVLPAELANAQYWVNNMVSPVRFTDALQTLTQKSSTLKVGLSGFSDIIEVGPHPALRRPVLDTIGQEGNRKKQIRYTGILHRSRPAVETTLEAVGQLFCLGHQVSISSVNQRMPSESSEFLLDLPEYPFDRTHRYWAESRISRDYRLRGKVHGETLGVRPSDWNPLEPSWRNFLTVEATPWFKDHVVDGTVLFPAMGMLVMAMEAVYQVVPEDQAVAGYYFQTAEFKNPVIIQETWEDRIETQMRLRTVNSPKVTGESQWFETTLYSYSRDQWTECFRATLKVEYKSGTASEVSKQRLEAHGEIRHYYYQAKSSCKNFISPDAFYRDAAKNGIQWGPSFQLIQDAFYDEKRNTAIGKIDISKGRHITGSLVHPAVLDQAFHMLRLSGGQQPSGNIPIRIQGAWFAASGWQSPHTNSIGLVAKSKVRSIVHGPSTGEDGSIHALADDGTVLCSIERAVTSPVARNEEDEERKLLYKIEWKPQLSLMTNEQLERECLSKVAARDESLILSNHIKLVNVLGLVAGRTLKTVDASTVPQKLSRHFKWLEDQVRNLSPSQREHVDSLSDEEVEARLVEVEEALPAWGVYIACARNLQRMLAGEVDPLQIVFESDQAKVFYENLFLNLCSDGRLFPVLDLASHQNPALRVIEVGAGTGGVTRHLFKAWGEREKRTGAPSFAHYTYTDISPMFFEKASNLWSDLVSQDRISFKTFDLGVPIQDQGFEAGTYDLLVAGSVMHATPDLEFTIRNVRKLLKPGGKLLLLETIKPSDIAVNFMAGLVPGWWVATEEWRANSAAVDESVWERCLRNNGFSGNDVVIRDYETEQCHIMSIIVTTAVEPKQDVLKATSRGVVVVTDATPSDQQSNLATAVVNKLQGDGESSVCSFTAASLQEAVKKWNEDTVVIFVGEVNNRPVLANLNEDDFSALQILMKHAKNLLWVTGTHSDDENYPDYSLVPGFLRTIRAEQPDNHIVNIAIEDRSNEEDCATIILTIFDDAFGQLPGKELEYNVQNGQITIGRAVENAPANEAHQALVSAQQKIMRWGDGPELQLSAGTHGDLTSLRFVRDELADTPLGQNEIEIEAHAWGLGRRELDSALGLIDEDQDKIGGDCAGIVTRVGSGCGNSIKEGDRVYMSTRGSIRKHPRALETSVIQIPDSLSFEKATSEIMPSMIAYRALVDISQLEKQERVLVNDGADSLGQSAIRIAQRQGAEIFVTVTSEEQRRFLVSNLSVQQNHVFLSEGSFFAQQISRATGGQGVDVVFNLLPGQDVLQASLKCLATNGHFVTVKGVDTDANTTLSLNQMKANVSFATVDVLRLTPSKASKLLQNTVDSIQESSYNFKKDLEVFEVSKIEKAFQQLQSGELNGRVVVTPKADNLVPQFSIDERSWKFLPNASYLVAGGSGGLGRDIIKWMVRRGARHLIVPSRSGATSEAAKVWVTELKASGVNIVTPLGCINAAMALEDAIFQDNMKFSQWDATVRSKVQTSWTLHKLLPNNLDFFIMFSSLAGVVGQMGSANYSAGCSFQDAIVRYRRSRGLKAISIDIGWMVNVGIIAEKFTFQRQRQIANDMQLLTDIDLLALLTMCCDPDVEYPQLEECRGQIPFGLDNPRRHLLLNEPVPPILDRPLLSTFSYVTGSSKADKGTKDDDVEKAVALFRQSSDSAERVALVFQALAARLGRAMSIPASDVEPNKALSAYGVDSLMAVELRNWIGRELGATVAVFDIVGAMPIASIADLIAERSTIGKPAK
ncbi:hypothetical protein V2G26_009938 [Clonostachys chloroleuca]